MSIDIKSIMKANDLHVVISGDNRTAKVYDAKGKLVTSYEARCYGQHPNWKVTNGDTPPGLYKLGVIYPTPGEAPYGNHCFDLIDLENQETGNNRGGISHHGGGSSLANPFAPKQGWVVTHGCIRSQNEDIDREAARYYALRKAHPGVEVYYTVHYDKGYLPA